jgi:hypothetical protein
MSTRATEQVPLDEVTGLPLPVYVRRSNYFMADIDFHHAFHPRKDLDLGYIPIAERQEALDDPELMEFFDELELSGMAVRYSRGQDLPKKIHQRYHNTFVGPPLPHTTGDKFTTAVLALSGIVPRKAIYLPRKGDYQIKGLTDKQHQFIASRERLHYESALSPDAAAHKRAWFGKFFAAYALEQSLTNLIPENLIAEFLDPKTKQDRIGELGRIMVLSAADERTESLKPIFREAKRQNMMINPKIRPKTVVRRYITQSGYLSYHLPLRRILAESVA